MNEQSKPRLAPMSVMAVLEASKREIEAGGPFLDLDDELEKLRQEFGLHRNRTPRGDASPE